MKTKYVVGVPYFGAGIILQEPPVRTGKLSHLNGLLNGIGGHIEINESPAQAMSRECYEETGQLIPRDRWVRVYGEEYEDAIVYFYICKLTAEESYEMVRRELGQPLHLKLLSEVSKLEVVPNIAIIAAMIRVRQSGVVPPLSIF